MGRSDVIGVEFVEPDSEDEAEVDEGTDDAEDFTDTIVLFLAAESVVFKLVVTGFGLGALHRKQNCRVPKQPFAPQTPQSQSAGFFALEGAGLAVFCIVFVVEVKATVASL